ncbi:helix-loop-helix protein [Biomphalaria glabrata]|nr:DNA-binding protein inhibitor ID-4-like [Biomphalaria glabrata]
MVITSINHQCRASAAQVVARRQVRMYLRKIREKEYSKLRALVPSVATKKKVTKVQVIEEAVRYIEKLHEALLERFRETHGSMAEDKAQETVRIFETKKSLGKGYMIVLFKVFKL